MSLSSALTCVSIGREVRVLPQLSPAREVLPAYSRFDRWLKSPKTLSLRGLISRANESSRELARNLIKLFSLSGSLARE